MNHERIVLPYGLSDIDPVVVEGYRQKDARFINHATDGGIVSPLKSEGRRWLKWMEGDYNNGSEFHGNPPIQVRVSGTYIYQEATNNFIVGRPLVTEALSGVWKKAETRRLGWENSEDALTWNVFRILQEWGSLQWLTSAAGIPHSPQNPDLYLWGRRVEIDGTKEWPRLREVRREFEQDKRIQTEPDAVVHFPHWGWLFVEAKLSSKTTTYATKPERVDEWRCRYARRCPATFDEKSITNTRGARFPEQLLRNIAFASQIPTAGERAMVVALVRELDQTPIENWVKPCLTKDCAVQFRRLTWEGLYRSFPPGQRGSDLIRRYLMNKTVNLRAAFNFNGVQRGLGA